MGRTLQTERKPKEQKKKKKNAKKPKIEKEEETKEIGNIDITAMKEQLLSYLTEPSWKDALKDEFEKLYFASICQELQNCQNKGVQVFPPLPEVFAALNATPLDKIKAVIIGQDPYHDNKQAHGFCFSVLKDVAIPKSLKNIYQELERDIKGFKAPNHGNLESWSKEGVLLLNATLTVVAHKANSHAQTGWQTFTDEIISIINSKREKVVFLLWGNFAHKKGKMIDEEKHKVIKTAHPSPLSVKSWQGCKTFSKANDALVSFGIEPINWQIE